MSEITRMYGLMLSFINCCLIVAARVLVDWCMNEYIYAITCRLLHLKLLLTERHLSRQQTIALHKIYIITYAFMSPRLLFRYNRENTNVDLMVIYNIYIYKDYISRTGWDFEPVNTYRKYPRRHS